MAAVAVLAAGAGVSAYAQYQAANQQADAYERQAYAKTLQAGEIMASANREAELTRQKGQQVYGSEISAFGRSGVQLAGTPLRHLQKTLEDANSEANAIMEAGRYRAFTSNFEAAGSMELAGQTRVGGGLSAFATVLGAGKDYAVGKGML